MPSYNHFHAPKMKRDRDGVVDLRKLAHQESGCLVRSPVCTDGRTALLHIRRGNPGMAMKPWNTSAVMGCDACHQYIGDGNNPEHADLVLGALCRQNDLYHEYGLRLK